MHNHILAKLYFVKKARLAIAPLSKAFMIYIITYLIMSYPDQIYASTWLYAFVMGSWTIFVTALWIIFASISSLLISQLIEAPSLSMFTHRLQNWQRVTKRNALIFALELVKHSVGVVHAKIIMFTCVNKSNAAHEFSALTLLVIVIVLDALPYEIEHLRSEGQ